MQRVKGSTIVLSIECLKANSISDEWTSNFLQTGDIVEELSIGNVIVKAPYKNGKWGVQKILHNSFKQKETLVLVRVRRGFNEYVEFHACIVPADQFLGKKSYMLRASDDMNYVVGFVERTENECLNLQGQGVFSSTTSRASRMVSALERTQLEDGYVSYPWESKMHEMLSIPNSSSFYSILFLPNASDKASSRYNNLENTLARAHAWINASQASGTPIVFMNIQTESLLTKISGDMASATVNAGSLADLSNLANTSLYGFEDYHGADIGVVRAVRIWFSPLVGEIPMEIKLKETDTKLGFAIGRTVEGFIYISSVIEGDDNVPAARSGLSNLYKQASKMSRLLVVSRISNQKVLPWMVSSTGSIRCFDTVSLSQKLSLHRHAKISILMHMFLWDRNINLSDVDSVRSLALSSSPSSAIDVHFGLPLNDNMFTRLEDECEVEDEGENEGSVGYGADNKIQKDTVGEFSFRFALKNKGL